MGIWNKGPARFWCWGEEMRVSLGIWKGSASIKINNDAHRIFSVLETQVFTIEDNNIATAIHLHFHHSEELETLLNMDAWFATIKPKKDAHNRDQVLTVFVINYF